MRLHTDKLRDYRFNSRTPGGVRPLRGEVDAGKCGVSIHAPREGCDSFGYDFGGGMPSFNSRTPGGVRHPGDILHDLPPKVSIHAPREGCDL